MIQERAYQDENLSHTGFRVLAYLAWIAKDGSVEGLTQDELATRLNMASRTLTRAVEELVQGQYLNVERKGGRTANTLTLIQPHETVSSLPSDSMDAKLAPLIARLTTLEQRLAKLENQPVKKDLSSNVPNDFPEDMHNQSQEAENVKNDHIANADHTETTTTPTEELPDQTGPQDATDQPDVDDKSDAQIVAPDQNIKNDQSVIKDHTEIAAVPTEETPDQIATHQASTEQDVKNDQPVIEDHSEIATTQTEQNTTSQVDTDDKSNVQEMPSELATKEVITPENKQDNNDQSAVVNLLNSNESAKDDKLNFVVESTESTQEETSMIPETQSANNDQSVNDDATNITLGPLGERLKAWRKQHRLTQNEAASRLSINLNTYRGYELGRRTPSSEELDRLLPIITD